MAAPVDVETISMTMRDGTALAADVYRPAGPGPWPALLMRQPYGRRIASAVVLAHPAWYAAQGYVVVVQDVRGRGDSGGRFRVLLDDVEDGADTLALTAALPGVDGRVGTYGFSYQGITQYLALAGARRAGNPLPHAMAIVMAPWSVRDDWVFEGGAFRLAANQGWALQMAAENARLRGDHGTAHALRMAAAGVGTGEIQGRLPALDAARAYTHYHDWLADDPDRWEAISPDSLLDPRDLSIPALHVGGWLDLMLTGTLAAYRAFARAGAPQQLLVGPWPHLPWPRHLGLVDGGPEAGDGVDRALLAFFDRHLKGVGAAAPALRLFDIGRGAFQDFSVWPETKSLVLYLASAGRAAASTEDGRLDEAPAEAGLDHLVHDPWRPAPSHAPHLATPAGFFDRAALDSRGDVAVYTSAPLEHPLTLLGPAEAMLTVGCDAASFDLHATLSIVDTGGRAMALTSGSISPLPGGAPAGFVVPMRPTFATLRAGQRLRLSVQAAAFPAFPVNPGTGARPVDSRLSEARIVTLTIGLGGKAGSGLRLSVLPAD